jgi:hypothetical protein
MSERELRAGERKKKKKRVLLADFRLTGYYTNLDRRRIAHTSFFFFLIFEWFAQPTAASPLCRPIFFF